MTFADGDGPKARSAPARSTQSRLSTTSTFFNPSTLSGDRARRTDIERMIGRKARANFEIGDYTGVQRFGKRNARVPRLAAARGSAGKKQNLFRAFEHFGCLADGIAGRRGRNLRHVTRDIDR